MAACFRFGGAQFSALRTIQSGFRLLAHLRDFGIVTLHEIGFVFEEFARRLIVTFADTLLLLFRRRFGSFFRRAFFGLGGSGTFGLGFAFRFLRRLRFALPGAA